MTRKAPALVDTNKYNTLKNKLTENFNTEQNIPKRIEAITAKEEDYAPLQLPTCGLTIPTPTSEIEKANKMAKNIIRNIDIQNSKLFNVYRDIIEDVLQFIRNNDILYVTATDDMYSRTVREEYDIARFMEGARALDKKITDAFPDMETPISRIVKDMKLDNSFQQSNAFINVFKNMLLQTYREGLSDIFKFIVIGEQ